MAKRQKIDEKDWLKGLNEAVDNLQEAVDKIQHGSVEGLKDALLYVATESQDKAPVEFGDLRGSVYVDIDDVRIAQGESSGLSDEEKRKRRKEGNVSAENGVGLTIISDEVPENGTVGTVGYNSIYAADQHEHTEYDHPLGGRAKYLESVLTSEKDRILKLIAGGIIDELED